MSTGLSLWSVPPEDEGLTAAIAKTFPATQLFLDRARADMAAHLHDSVLQTLASLTAWL